MRIEELQIGMWVDSQHGAGRITNIDRFDSERKNDDRVCLDHFVVVSVEDLKGIPITPEFLLENDFKRSDHGLYDLDYEFQGKYDYVYLCPQKSTVYGTNWRIFSGTLRFHDGGISIEYVHELQEVLHLAKIDKKIKLWTEK